MEMAEIQRRWQAAKDNLAAARLCHDHGLYGPGITRSYYSCFQAMWVAVGDPPKGWWRHGGLINQFCHDQWATPPMAPSALKPIRTGLVKLYDLRSSTDYQAEAITASESQSGIDLTIQILQTVALQRVCLYETV
jgi:uncharacterized protein (UPF0332 family)